MWILYGPWVNGTVSKLEPSPRAVLVSASKIDICRPGSGHTDGYISHQVCEEAIVVFDHVWGTGANWGLSRFSEVQMIMFPTSSQGH